VDAISTNHTQGALMETNNSTDIAIRGQGLFMVQTDRGRRYTRQGSFSIDGLGRLVTESGDQVLTVTGAPIHVDGRNFEVNSDGTMFLDGTDSGRLAVMVPDDPEFLVKEGESLYAPAPGARFRASSATVLQGHLERANVNAVLEMAAMLHALRAYEANQRAIVAQDGTLNTLISQVGRFG
jgi:flagellar basal-body rod protein FlgG